MSESVPEPAAEHIGDGGAPISGGHVTEQVTTADGVVRGGRGRRVRYWRSLPYAAPPVGDLRFRAPQPVQPWTDIRDATYFRAAGIQPGFGVRIGPRKLQEMSEDSLTLNVVAPAAPAVRPRPVMVFIHGGGNLFGTSALRLYAGVQLAADGDVVMVSINYRLGAFGYADFSEFSTPDSPYDSNLGLRDQIAALRWVQTNIAEFGGDPGNVTIFGESAGAHAVLSLLATPSAAGLFHRGIAQSPPADWGLTIAEASEFAHRVLAELSIAPQDANRLLREVDPHDIRRAFNRASNAAMAEFPGFFPAAPVADGDLLPRTPIDAFAEGHTHRVPLIIGTCRNEGALFNRFTDSLPTRPERLKRALSLAGPDHYPQVFYTYPGFPGEAAAIRAGGDYFFWRPSLEVMEGHSRHSPTYAYRYDFAPRLLRMYKLGATHATDLLPTFGAVYEPWSRALTIGGSRRGLLAVTRRIQDNWLNFARTGEPLPVWPRYTEADRSTLIIDDPGRVDNDPDSAQRKLWAGVRAPRLVPHDTTAKTVGALTESAAANEAGGDGSLLGKITPENAAGTPAEVATTVTKKLTESIEPPGTDAGSGNSGPDSGGKPVTEAGRDAADPATKSGRAASPDASGRNSGD
ncbi:carboxylesterase/lipase family protein [Nocardia speluncae]|uniref:Carboxylic ester hydrolase n=1 Tax=Nocardia speluncae TaxID=419477 RepID=A0A846XG68_9NOCA|nr:carboxylesterase/lipase family protein [Nocardia speluncae]NKY34457.1 carboxylesterase/lipase family protein [Nocardia speluncae]